MLSLRDIMTPEVITVGADTPLAEVAELFATEGISGVPVVTAHRVLGVVSASDVMDFSAADFGEQTSGGGPLWESAGETRDEPQVAPFYYDPWTDRQQPIEADEWDPAQASLFGEFTAADVMTRRLYALAPDTPIDEAAGYMVARGIHRVLVIEDDTLVGIVTSMDFVRAVAHRNALVAGA
jgi:CBS domain-containing protein